MITISITGFFRPMPQDIFDFSEQPAIVDDYRRLLMQQIKLDMQTLLLDLYGPEGKEFYEQRIRSFRAEIDQLDRKGATV